MTKVKLSNLNVSYAGNDVLHNINVEIPDKKLTVIMGPSGCGKTTMLKSINRIFDLYEEVKVKGRVFIGNVDIYDPKTDVLALRKRIGFLSQNPCPLPMSIYDNVAFGPRLHKMTASQIMCQLKEMGWKNLCMPGNRKPMDMLVEYYLKIADLWEEVKDRLHSPASKLSIGQQQRLALARTLAIEPEIILADEPTSALDPISAKLIETQFNKLKKKYTIVVVTHTLRQAKRIADYVIFVYLGDLIEHGPASKMFKSPKNKKTRDYIKGELI